jgi:hypothetical protein
MHQRMAGGAHQRASGDIAAAVAAILSQSGSRRRFGVE